MRQRHTISESHDTDDEADEFQFCLRNRYTPRCLVGVHKLSEGEADPQVGRWNRLLDTPKTHVPAVQQPMDNGAAVPREKDHRPHGVLMKELPGHTSTCIGLDYNVFRAERPFTVEKVLEKGIAFRKISCVQLGYSPLFRCTDRNSARPKAAKDVLSGRYTHRGG